MTTIPTTMTTATAIATLTFARNDDSNSICDNGIREERQKPVDANVKIDPIDKRTHLHDAHDGFVGLRADDIPRHHHQLLSLRLRHKALPKAHTNTNRTSRKKNREIHRSVDSKKHQCLVHRQNNAIQWVRSSQGLHFIPQTTWHTHTNDSSTDG